MTAEHRSSPPPKNSGRERQGELLQQREGELRNLASEGKREEFFQQIVRLLDPLKSYIKRRLRAAYLDLDVQTPVQTTGDLLDKVILKAFENYNQKPDSLSLEQWLYQFANEVLERYIKRRKSVDPRRRSFETLEQKERRDLEEIPFTADAEGEPYMLEDLDDSEYHLADFLPVKPTSQYQPDPEQELEREEEVDLILQALFRLPERERLVFELFEVEGFSKDAVARIMNISPDEVERIAENVKQQVRHDVSAALGTGEKQQKAS